MRNSAVQTIQNYLEKAQKRLELKDIEKNDLEKAKKHIQKAEEEINKETK